MKLTIAALRSGTDPVGPLPPAAFHRTLEEPLVCPKCHVSYNLVVDYDQSVGRFFEQESRPLILLLKKTILIGHSHGHRITHFETSGVVVKRYTEAETKGLTQT
jgi:hypothetical protein